MAKIAITGGIAEGKTTVMAMVHAAGLSTLSADDVARSLIDEPSIQREIGELFSLPLPLDRSRLRAAVLASSDARRSLNALLHPLVIERILASGADVYEIPLLIETCTQHFFEKVWVVTCGSDLQRERLMKRLNDKKLAETLLAAQLPTIVKCAFADQIIRTNSTMSDVNNCVVTALLEDGLLRDAR